MNKLILVLLLIVPLPAFILILLLGYKMNTDLQKRRFEKKGGLVLTRSRIGEILEHLSPSQAVRIFKSAICDHSEVEGFIYFTKYPFGGSLIVAHDNHRKAFIAHEIGQMLTREVVSQRDDMDVCFDVLFYLTDYSREAFYTQAIAWNSLSKLVDVQETALEHIRIDYLKKCISKGLVEGLGVVKFVFGLKHFKVLDAVTANIIKEIFFHVIQLRDFSLIALLVYKLSKSSSFSQSQKKFFMDRLPNNTEFNRFLRHMEILSFGFTHDELTEGLKSFGLKAPPYSKKSTEGEIVRFLLTDFIEEIYVPIAYKKHSYDDWSNPRDLSSDFLWFY